jgi:hypothetical protein
MSVSNLHEIGINKNYWYPIGREADFPKNKPVPVTVWGSRFVVFRLRDGIWRALEDRCLHRKVALSAGTVTDCAIICPFHGWEYDHDGLLHRIPYWHDQPVPRLRVCSFPVKAVGGLIWLWPGSSEPDAGSELFARVEGMHEGRFRVIMDRTFDNHFSFGVINGMDFFHFHLHRKYQPWGDIRIASLMHDDRSVTASYEITFARNWPARLFNAILRTSPPTTTDRIVAEYVYPHHFARINEDMVVGAYFLPIDRHKVRVFIDMFFPRGGWTSLLRQFRVGVLQRTIFVRIQAEDAWIGVLEQEASERHPDIKRRELSPVSQAVERVMVGQWRNSEAGSSRRWHGVVEEELDQMTELAHG